MNFINLEFEYKHTIRGNRLKIEFENLNDAMDVEGNELAFIQSETNLSYFMFIVVEDKQAVAAMESAADAGVMVVILSVLPLIMAGSAAIFWGLLDVLQILNIMTYLNVNFPSNVDVLFQMLGMANLDFIPDVFGGILEYFDVGMPVVSAPMVFER